MRYSEQQQYFLGSRVWGSLVAILLAISAATVAKSPASLKPLYAVEYVLIGLALAISIYYTPDYLHLTVTPAKAVRWQIKVRWRISAAVLVLGLVSLPHAADAWVIVIAVIWLIAANYLAGKAATASPLLYFCATDFVLLAVFLLLGKLNFVLATILIAASAHLAAVSAKKFPVLCGMSIGLLGCGLIALGVWRSGNGAGAFVAAAVLVLISALGTALLVERAQQHNVRNVNAAMTELIDFTGESAERIRELWAVSNEKLAENWKSAELAENDPERLAQWYRDNSRLYLFAISAYNLEYKRIRSNLKVLPLARGSCLDYGAGNGEILLELARGGHPAAYYDVEGETMAFARHRAAQQRLSIQFLGSKDELAAVARERPFDTVFSFDVLEHLPDLPGELDFLSSLLGRGGLLVFDVPAGATKSHPMHLNHQLDVSRHLQNKGLRDERGFLQRMPFRKEEKYFFRAV